MMTGPSSQDCGNANKVPIRQKQVARRNMIKIDSEKYKNTKFNLMN
jgi:hypothetical protein